MNGAEHYREAERLINGAKDAPGAYVHTIALAQVHATLALAAAQAAGPLMEMCGDSNRITEWGEAIGWDDAPERGRPADDEQVTYLNPNYCNKPTEGGLCVWPVGHDFPCSVVPF
ncbi:hypothetical protein [Saccharothrix stipae]